MTYKYKDEPLPILISARVRLDNEQRRTIKDAYYEQKNQTSSTEDETTGLKTITTISTDVFDKQLGMSGLVFSDTINSRDSISLSIVLRIQRVLGVEVITKKQVMDACKNYCEYMFLP
jgi:hypothetical protein